MGKIGFFNTAQAWGGGEKWHFEISRHLHRNGHEVFVFAHKNSVLSRKLNAAKIPNEAITVNNLSFLNPWLRSKITAIFQNHGFQALVINLSRDLKLAGPCAKKAGIPRIIYRRGSAIPIKDSLLNRYYFKAIVTNILANSQATKKTINANNPHLFPEDRIKVIYNGIQMDKVPPLKPRLGPLTLGNLGRLEHQKNQGFLVGLATELKKRHLDVKINIGGEGRLRDELQKSIAENDLEKEIELLGFIETPLAFMQACDVFVLPSLWEGFGYVLAEAALCKKPIVAFDVSSNPELVRHGKTGYLVPVGDLQAFADKIELLYHNKELRKQLGHAGHDYVTKHFETSKQLEHIKTYLVHD